MESTTHRQASLLTGILVFVCFLCLCLGQTPADDQACVSPLETLLPCLPYAQDQAKQPTATCCANMNKVFATQKKCLCELMAASVENSTTSGLPPLNPTRSMGLPAACGLQADPTRCPGLLGISPSSPEARIFLTPGSSTTPASNGTTGTIQSPTTASPLTTAANSDAKKNGASVSVHRSLPLTLSGAVVILLELLVL